MIYRCLDNLVLYVNCPSYLKSAWGIVHSLAWTAHDHEFISAWVAAIIFYSRFLHDLWLFNSCNPRGIRPRSLRWKNKPKHCSGWFVVRKKYCFGWKNKLKKTDYKISEPDLSNWVVISKKKSKWVVATPRNWAPLHREPFLDKKWRYLSFVNCHRLMLYSLLLPCTC